MDYTKIPLGELLSHANETIKRNAMSILKQLQRLPLSQQESFPITSVAREDLQEIGFDTSNVDDTTMRNIAERMADAYVENSFWIDLAIIAEYNGVPKKKN